MMLMTKPPISADSHITEHPDTYRKYIDPALRDRAPHLVHDDAGGDLYVIPDLTQGALPMGLIAAAGKRPEDIRPTGRFEEWHRGGWDPDARLAAQERDGVTADELFEATIALGLPVSFHILTDPQDAFPKRGPVMNFAVGIIRSNQDLLAMLVYGGVFERHPRLRVVCVEADASWAPHWMHRMDHYYERHRYMRALELARLPSEYFREHVYLTFQDDWPAFRMTGLLDPRRLMWANDFPHSDSTWPWSQELLAREAACLSEGERDLILHDNAAELYGIEGV